MGKKSALCAAALVALAITASFADGRVDGRAVANDNRLPAGVLRDRVLTLNLEIREVEWYPEAENGPHLPVYAFAEAGRPAMVPGPLIRVPAHTRIDLTLKNTLTHAMEVHGFVTHPGNDDLIALAAGEQRELHFDAGSAGTYVYSAFDPLRVVSKLRLPSGESNLSTGAFVVDTPGAPTDDRVFVINLWRHTGEDGAFDAEFGAINGKSWPYSEHMSFPLGRAAHWRWINASVAIHPMHLHGAYYRVDARGDGLRDTRLDEDQRPMVVTENMKPGSTMEMTWKPDRPGHWLFHCHIIGHIDTEASLSAIQKAPQDHHVTLGMAGLVLGTEVTAPVQVQRASYANARRLTLTLSDVAKDAIHVELRDGRQKSSSTALMGPPIILHRGESTEIAVVNHLAENTSIHWHGMELESYYDGVPDYSGIGNRTAPPVAPGKSFLARMRPPRAGTFIYHTHWHDIDQLDRGLYGPLIVLEPGERYRPRQDVTFVAGLTVKEEDGPLLVNGMEHPEVVVDPGHVRLRLINITPNNTALRFTLRAQDKPVRWRHLAKDGMELPEAQSKTSEAVQAVGVGETYDFELNTNSGDTFTLEGFLPGPKLKVVATIRVQ